MRGELHIQTLWRNDKTCLKKAFCTAPFKVADVTEDKTSHKLRLMLMNSSPGILDGDEYKLRIEVGEGCSLELQTQSYQRLFNMKKSASQRLEAHIEPGASFSFLPHPVVPHEASDFSASNKIFLCSGSQFIWGEVLTCGRKLSGEVFRFSKYHAITEIFLAGRMVLKENLYLEPNAGNLDQIGQMEGFSHQATLIFLNENAQIKDLIMDISDWLTSQPGIMFGVSAAPINGFIARLLGNKAEKLFECLKVIAGIASVYSNKN